MKSYSFFLMQLSNFAKNVLNFKGSAYFFWGEGKLLRRAFIQDVLVLYEFIMVQGCYLLWLLSKVYGM